MGPGFREATSTARGWSDREQRARFHKAGSTERGGASSALPCLGAHVRTCLWDVGVSFSGLGWGSLRRECHFHLVFLSRAVARSGPLCRAQSRPLLSWTHVHVRIRTCGDADAGASSFGLGSGSLRRDCFFRLVFLLRVIAVFGPLCRAQRRPVPSWKHTHVRIRTTSAGARGDAGCKRQRQRWRAALLIAKPSGRHCDCVCCMHTSHLCFFDASSLGIGHLPL